MHPRLEQTVERYLVVADRVLPGRVRGLYVVGSAALDAYRPERSDIDLVAVLADEPVPGELRRLRTLQVLANLGPGARAVVRGQLAFPGTANASFIREGDRTTPVTQIRPVASHVGVAFVRGAAFDVNPVVWKELADRGIAVRGPAPGELGLDPEPERLRAWNLDNLNSYWASWARRTLDGRAPMSPVAPRRWVGAWGALGPPRLHHTIVTGEIVSKEAAGEYALDMFDGRWHPVLADALAYRRGAPPVADLGDRRTHLRTVAELTLQVIADANARCVEAP